MCSSSSMLILLIRNVQWLNLISSDVSMALTRRPATFAQAAKLRRSAATKEKELAQCEYPYILLCSALSDCLV